MKKIIALSSLVVLIVILYFFTPVRNSLSQENLNAMQSWVRSQGGAAPLVFSLVYIIATTLALPGSALTLAGGLLFGVPFGTLLNLTSATLGAILAFLIARYLGRDFAKKHLHGKLAGLDDRIGRNGFMSVLILRLVPLFPFNVLNYGLGLTKVKNRDYILATLIGMAPGAFAYTALGATGQRIRWSDPSTLADWRVWGPFTLVIFLTILTRLVMKRNHHE